MADNSNSSGNQNSGQKPSLSWSQPAAPQASTTKPVAPAQPKAAPHAANTPAAQQANSAMGTYVGIFAAGIIVGALLGWGITSSNGGSSTTASSTDMTASTTSTGTKQNTTSTTVTDAVMGRSGNILLADTQTAGFAVSVTKVSVSQPTWLVVYEDVNGAPGNAIGAGLFFPDSTSGTIELLRATLPGTSYFVGQSLDDGDKIFSLATDKPVRDEKGNPLFTQFTAK